MATDGSIHVAVVYSSAPRQVREVCLSMARGTTVAQALQASGLCSEYTELAGGDLVLGIWGRKCTPDQELRDHDRVEIYRPLKVDPKVARRERFVRQGARAAGLFARKRPGSKAGY